ncbi:ABC transporter ATP-binding protein [Loktanella sp. M215]|uniref:ABC transporter ATP-binding protein n=1 Tax=Loktanella sp. M215 TaxID=2675431 RepID=UPI001F3CFBDF|nr:ABC transporter ATP-binding protein [Loktanella sp. M215]MCF7701841.1 ATP-binding cassette domain-containing protein [Loktanella sp. M215]
MSGLQVNHVGFSYGAKRALDDVTFAVTPGTFCALLGPNGAGKSTLFGLLTRLFTTPDGTIKVAGHDLATDVRRAMAQIGVVFQQSTLDLDLSVRRNLLYFAALHGLAGPKATSRVDEVLDVMRMKERAHERARDLNGGHRRRCEIARALMHEPAVLLLDEPTVGLDAASRAGIVDHVHDLCTQRGLTVFWATHLTDEVRPADQVVILHKGLVLADASCAVLTEGGNLQDIFLRLTQVPV